MTRARCTAFVLQRETRLVAADRILTRDDDGEHTTYPSFLLVHILRARRHISAFHERLLHGFVEPFVARGDMLPENIAVQFESLDVEFHRFIGVVKLQRRQTNERIEMATSPWLFLHVVRVREASSRPIRVRDGRG